MRKQGGMLYPTALRWQCAFLQRIHARPAYQKALEQGGPFDLLT